MISFFPGRWGQSVGSCRTTLGQSKGVSSSERVILRRKVMEGANGRWERAHSPRTLPLGQCITSCDTVQVGCTLNPSWLFDAKGNLWMWWFPLSDLWNSVASDFPVLCWLCEVTTLCESYDASSAQRTACDFVFPQDSQLYTRCTEMKQVPPCSLKCGPHQGTLHP